MSLLEVEDLHVWFDLPRGGQVHAAAGVSFALDAGERFGLAGLGGELLSGGHKLAGGLADHLDGVNFGIGWAGLRAGRIVHSRTSFPVRPGEYGVQAPPRAALRAGLLTLYR